MLFTSQAPVLDLAGKHIKTKEDIEATFHTLHLCPEEEKEDQKSDGRHTDKINKDTSDNDTDEMITFDNDKAKKTYRIGINSLRKRAKTERTEKSRTAKMYTMNIERKKLLKQRREKAIQNAKDRKMAK